LLELQDSMDSAEGQSGALSKKLKTLETEMEELREQLDEEQSARSTAEDLVRKRDTEIENLKRQLAEALEKIAKLEKEKKSSSR